MAKNKRAKGKSRSRKSSPVKDLGPRTARSVRGGDKSSTKLFLTDQKAGDLSASVKFKY